MQSEVSWRLVITLTLFAVACSGPGEFEGHYEVVLDETWWGEWGDRPQNAEPTGRIARPGGGVELPLFGPDRSAFERDWFVLRSTPDFIEFVECDGKHGCKATNEDWLVRDDGDYEAYGGFWLDDDGECTPGRITHHLTYTPRGVRLEHWRWMGLTTVAADSADSCFGPALSADYDGSWGLFMFSVIEGE